jgi:hypothetical protein
VKCDTPCLADGVVFCRENSMREVSTIEWKRVSARSMAVANLAERRF